MIQTNPSCQKRTLFWSLFILGVWFAMAACEGRPPEQATLRIGHAPHDHHAPLYVAALNPGHFKKNGDLYLKEIVFRKEYMLISHGNPMARILIDSVTGGKELIRALYEDNFDFSFGGVPAMLHFIDQGADIKILSPVMSEGAGFAVHADLPFDDWGGFANYIRHQSRPFRVGYKMSLSVQNLIFETALHESNISVGHGLDELGVQVQLLNLHGAEHLSSALTNGLIDGFVVMQPYLAQAKRNAEIKIISMLKDLPPKGRWHGYPCCALAANTTFLTTHPEESTALLTLLMRANRYIRNHPEESAAQAAKWLGTSPEVETDAMGTIRFGIDFTEDWNNGVQYWVKTMIDSGAVTDRVKRMFEHDPALSQIYAKDIFDRAKRKM
jgi:NitT/TauT family transport system substrate-binding protein